MNRDRCIRFGGLVGGRRCSARHLWLIVSWNRGSRWCWSRCLRGLRGAETFLPDQHADQEDDQCNTDHSSWRGESPMVLRRLNLVELFEQLACVEFSVVFGPESLDGHGVGPAEEFCQLAGPVHGLLLDLDDFGFVLRDHVIHSPDLHPGSTVTVSLELIWQVWIVFRA